MNRLSLQGCLISTALLAALLPCPVRAQEQAAAAPSKAAPSQSRAEEYEAFRRNSYDQSYKLRYATSTADQNEILTAIRNMTEPATKIFLVPSVGAIVVHAPKETQDQIAKLLAALDHSHPRYRLTYTLSEFDGPKKIGVQHFGLVLAAGQRGELKQGSRVPYSNGGIQFSYLDIGINFDATLVEIEGGAVLKSKVDQTSVEPESLAQDHPQPLIRQTSLTGTTQLLLNKPLLLGSLDVPRSTHRFEVEALLETAN